MRFLYYILFDAIIASSAFCGLPPTSNETQTIDLTLAREFVKRNLLDSAEKYAWLAYDRLKEDDVYKDSIVISAHLLVSILNELNKNQEALKVILYILPEAEQLGNDTLLARSYEYAGKFHYQVFQTNEAKNMLTKAYEIYINIDEGRAVQQLRNLAVLKSQFGNHEEALKDYRSIYLYYQKNPEVEGMAITMINIGSVFTSLEQFDSAIFYLEKVKSIGDKLKAGTLQQGYHYLAKAYLRNKKLSESLKYAEKAYSLALEQNAQMDIAQSTVLLSEISLELADFQSAYNYRSTGDSIMAMMFHKDYGNQIAELKVKYQAEQKQRKIDVLNYESKVAKNRKIILIILVGSLAIIIALLIAYIFKRNQLHRNELQKSKLKRSKVVQELEFKKNEFTTNSLNVIHKDQLLQDIKSNIEGIKKKNNLNPDASLELGQLIKKVDLSFNLEQTWKDFKIHFENVHKDFFSHLLKQYPTISNHELRLCALVKLNLSIKEMAIILNISIQGVKTARYRLRKKFGLNKDQKLAHFLVSIEEEMLAAAL